MKRLHKENEALEKRVADTERAMAEVQDSKKELEEEYAQLKNKDESREMELQVKNERMQSLERKTQEQEAQVHPKNWVMCPRVFEQAYRLGVAWWRRGFR